MAMIMRKQMSHGLVAHFSALNAIKHSPFDFFLIKIVLINFFQLNRFMVLELSKLILFYRINPKRINFILIPNLNYYSIK